MAWRLRKARLVQVTCRPTAPIPDPTGGIARIKLAEEAAFAFKGLLLPPQRRVTRSVSGVRLATVWSLIPQGFPAVKEQDYLYFPGDTSTYIVTSVKRYPRHLAFNLELLH